MTREELLAQLEAQAKTLGLSGLSGLLKRLLDTANFCETYQTVRPLLEAAVLVLGLLGLFKAEFLGMSATLQGLIALSDHWCKVGETSKGDGNVEL